MGRAASVGLFLICVGCAEPFPAATELLTACPHDVPGCIVMTLDAPDLASILLKRVPAPGIQQALFSLQLPMRTEDGMRGTTELSVRAFVDGMDCDAFGQANAAVVGFTDSAEPIVLTSTGPLVVEEGALRVGCAECAYLVTSTGEPAAPAATLPAWDLTLARVRWGSVSYRDNGHLLVPQEGRCVEVPRTGAVVGIRKEECVDPQKVEAPSSAPLVPYGEPWPTYYAAPGRAYLLRLNTGACT
jgi:hypothetical protein